jgi:hypothetical protein
VKIEPVDVRRLMAEKQAAGPGDGVHHTISSSGSRLLPDFVRAKCVGSGSGR